MRLSGTSTPEMGNARVIFKIGRGDIMLRRAARRALAGAPREVARKGRYARPHPVYHTAFTAARAGRQGREAGLSRGRPGTTLVR